MVDIALGYIGIISGLFIVIFGTEALDATSLLFPALYALSSILLFGQGVVRKQEGVRHKVVLSLLFLFIPSLIYLRLSYS